MKHEYIYKVSHGGTTLISKDEEIIRCKDCKRWTKGDDYWGICNWNKYQELQTPFDGFCYQGERGEK